ncbi:MAG: hypothetical protein JWO30_308 [Fibrobacteres bacterium]|nr:hypothetical protein [Fibrobacterota bacterium]
MPRIQAIAIAFQLSAASLCLAQTVDIKGVVKDAAGMGIPGVVLKLEKTAFQATSGADGSFTLNDKSSAIPARNGVVRPARLSASVEQGSLWIQVPEKGNVAVTAFGMGGKELSTLRLKMDAGANAIPLPHRGQGLVFYRIQANGHEVMTRSLILSANGTADAIPTSTSASTAAAAKAPLAKRALTGASAFKDILAADKSGFLKYRLAVSSPTATGLEVRMVASAGAVKDGDGNEYETVKIGNQVWTAEHLRATKYADGTAIPKVADQAGWANRATPAFCYYNGMSNPDSIKRFGALYNWHVINTKKLAPEGWHIPSETDWMALQNAMIAGGFNFDGTATGNKIGKSMAAMTDWMASAKAGAIGNDQSKNNKSGFSGVPTGFRDQGGNFTSMGARCIMHSSNNKENTFGYFADLDNTSETLRYSDDWMSMGFLVRLVKN